MGLDYEREVKLREVEESVYQEFLRSVGDVPETEWQYFALACASRLIEGVRISQRSRLMGGDLEKIMGATKSDRPRPE